MRTNSKKGKKPFSELLNKPEDFNLVLESIEHTIFSSFAIDAKVTGCKPKITQDKIKQRWNICEKWFRYMRGDLGWGMIKTLDTIPEALACELLDIEFDTSKYSKSSFVSDSIHGIANRLIK